MSTQATTPAQTVEISSETATQPRPVSRRTMNRRMAVKVWYPKASDLPLLHLPEEIRAHVRRRLAPWLGELAVEGGNCWQVAQSLAMAAGDDSGVRYVEGVWCRETKPLSMKPVKPKPMMQTLFIPATRRAPT